MAANVLRSELIGGAMKMLDECGDVQEVQSNGPVGVVVPAGALPAMRWRRYFIITPPQRGDPIYSSARLTVFLPLSGFVQPC